MPIHVLQRNESIYTLAKAYNIPVDTIWNHARNNSLKESRKSPGVLHQGDEVFVPAPRAASFDVTAAQRHKFVMSSVLVSWGVQFVEPAGPRANWAYEAKVDGKSFEGQLDGNGWLRLKVPSHASRIEVTITPPEDALEDDDGHERFIERHTFRLHQLDPADTPSGVRQRLRSMGISLRGDPLQWDASLRSALRFFQKSNGLNATGEVDDSTRSKLESVFGT